MNYKEVGIYVGLFIAKKYGKQTTSNIKVAPYSYLNMGDWYRNISNAWKFCGGGKNFAWCARSLRDRRGSFKYQAKFFKTNMAAKFNNRLSSGKFGTVSARHINQTAKLQEGYVR